jgi:peptidoglycan/xylan/chitin deacetylase (PgdA/CDA1 family)
MNFNKDNAGFTLSLDCEGLWGMADQQAVLSAGRINDATLREVYQLILRTLDQNSIKATAAFVSCFAAQREAVLQCLDLIRGLAEYSPEWFSNIVPTLEGAQHSGWDGYEHFKAFQRAGHEMGWHGATHMPLSVKTSPEAVELEISLAKRLFASLGVTPKTIVFPRNRVGHLDRLRGEGFNAYRASLPGGVRGRVTSLAGELHLLDNRVAAKPIHHDGWGASPAGFFLNWPSGVRSLVPLVITVRRWKSLLRSAVENGGYVHMWFHPHNLITAPAMRESFTEIMDEVGALVRSGDLSSMTIAQANDYYNEVAH